MGRVHLTMRQLFLHCAALLVISSADIGAEAWGTNSEHFFFLDYEQSADSRRVADAIHKAFPDVRAITGDTERVFVRCTQEREKEVRTRLKQLGLLPAGEADATMQWISFDDDRALDAAMAVLQEDQHLTIQVIPNPRDRQILIMGARADLAKAKKLIGLELTPEERQAESGPRE